MDPTEYVVRIHGKNVDGSKYTGTGFFVSPKGEVATCWHVVKDAEEIFVSLPFRKNLLYEVADKREKDDEDVAVLQPKVPLLAATAYATLDRSWRDSIVAGNRVTVLGYSADPSVVAPPRFDCSVSSTSPEFGLILLQCSLNPGDSGGPVLNDGGRVIGIARLKDEREGQSFITPVSLLFELLKGSGTPAEVAIGELRDQTRKHDAVREAVQPYGSAIEKAGRQITVLTTYKEVHDLLHDVQYGCYDRLAIEAKRFADDEYTQEQMSLYSSELKRYVETADDILAEAEEESRGLIGKVRERLKQVSDAVEAAYEQRDKKQCELAVARLHQLVFGPTPAQFNDLLNRAARGLDIQGLMAAIQDAGEAVAKISSEQAGAELFRRGAEDLRALGLELNARTQEHDAWQGIDNELRTITGSGPNVLSGLEVIWQDIRAQIESVCALALRHEGGGESASVPEWAAGLAEEMAGVEKHLVAGDETRVRRQFASLRQRAAQRFHRVDKRLLQVCENIGKVREPLLALSEVLK